MWLTFLLSVTIAFCTSRVSADARTDCDNGKIRAYIEQAVHEHPNDMRALATDVQERAEKWVHGHWEVIAAPCPFGFANWYTNQYCKLKVNDVHVVAWQD